MQYVVTIYIDPTLVGELPEGKFDAMMRDCFDHVEHLAAKGKIVGSQMLVDAGEAKTLRTRSAKRVVLDGPFAETKEVLGGFNIIEADSMDEAVEIASHFPWHAVGSVEVRAVQSIEAVQVKVGWCAPGEAIAARQKAGAA